MGGHAEDGSRVMRIRTANKRARRKRSTTPHYRMTDRKWYWTWPDYAEMPFRGYRYYGN